MSHTAPSAWCLRETNHWEEQLYLGLDLEAQTEYGSAPGDYERIFEIVRLAAKKFGQRKLAKASGVSLSEVSAILRGRRRPTPATLARLYRAVSQLEREASEEAEHVREVLDAVRKRCQLVGVRGFATRAGVDAANLARVLEGRREPSRRMLAKMESALAWIPNCQEAEPIGVQRKRQFMVGTSAVCRIITLGQAQIQERLDPRC